MWWSPPSYTAKRSHSNTPSESLRIGAPASPHDHGVTPKRSSSRVEKRIDAGCWPVCSTLIAKCDALVSASAVAASLWTHTRSSGGSSETEVKLLTVRPAGVTAESTQVTTVTPVAKQPSASRRVRGSCPLRYSPFVDGSATDGAITRLRRSASNLSAGRHLTGISFARLPPSARFGR